MIAVVTGERWYLTVVLICLPLVIRAVEHLRLPLGSACVLRKSVCLGLPPVIWLHSLLLLILSCMNSLYILMIELFLVDPLQVFSPIVRVIFPFVLVSSGVQKFLFYLGPICFF